MDEPIKKRLKIEETDIESVLTVFQQHLLRNCLCTFSKYDLQKLFILLRTDSTSILTTDQKLRLIASIQLMCDIAIKQNIERHICAVIASICNLFARHEIQLTDYFLKLSEDTNPYISFATSRTVSSFYLIVRMYNNDKQLDDDRMLLNSVTASLMECSRLDSESLSLDTVSFSLNVLKRLIDWRKVNAHMLEDSYLEDDNRVAVENCRTLTVIDSQRINFLQIKRTCINSLKPHWPAIVNNFNNFVVKNDPMYNYHIITFLNLWQTIISVTGNLSVEHTKLFHSNLEVYIQLLSSNDIPVIWEHILNLLNEVLCYGSTLALQGALEDEPCDLAHSIVNNVKNPRNPNRNLLQLVPLRGSSERTKADKVLLNKLILLILKAVAITVIETRCDSSCDSSPDSDMEEFDNDMVVIARSMEKVLDQLDTRVKQLLFFHPEVPLAHWIVQVFADQDDYLIESMVCCLDVAVSLCYRETTPAQLHQKLNPTITFLHFLQSVSFNANVLLYFLRSKETCFLHYIMKYLKYVCKNWREFMDGCSNEIGRVFTVLIDLEKLIDDLIEKKQFPYNVEPILKLLKKCIQCLSTG